MFGQKKQPNSAKLIEQFKKGEVTYEEATQQVDIYKLAAELDDVENNAKDHGNIVDLRHIWGKVILVILMLTILSDFFLIGMVGSGFWKFENNSQFLNIVAAEHLAQIFGLVLIVLRALFPVNDKK